MDTIGESQSLIRVSIIVLNWNGWEDTIECLNSLLRCSYKLLDIVIVDNKSSDDSVMRVEEFCERTAPGSLSRHEYSHANGETFSSNLPDINGLLVSNSRAPTALKPRISMICIDENLGFAGGNNVGIKFAVSSYHPQYVLLLNNDTVVKSDFVEELMNVAESNDSIGALSPAILYYDRNGMSNIVNFGGGRLNWWIFPCYFEFGYRHKVIDCIQEQVIECDWVTGAAMMIRIREGFPYYLDSSYFFGCEDVDFCIKLRERGGKVVVAPKSIVWHKIASSRISKNPGLLKRMNKEIKTTLKFIYMNNKWYLLQIPLYSIQIILIYFLSILNRISHDRVKYLLHI